MDHQALGLPIQITGDDPRRKFRKLMRNLAENRKTSYVISQTTGAYMFPGFAVGIDEQGNVQVQATNGEDLSSFQEGHAIRGSSTRSKRLKVDGQDGKVHIRQRMEIRPTISLDDYREALVQLLSEEHSLIDGSGHKTQYYWYSFSVVQLYTLNSGDVDLSWEMINKKLTHLGYQVSEYVMLPNNIIGFGPINP